MTCVKDPMMNNQTHHVYFSTDYQTNPASVCIYTHTGLGDGRMNTNMSVCVYMWVSNLGDGHGLRQFPKPEGKSRVGGKKSPRSFTTITHSPSAH